MGRFLRFFRGISGNFFAGYLLGICTMVFMPRILFQKLALEYYEFKEIDDTALEN